MLQESDCEEVTEGMWMHHAFADAEFVCHVIEAFLHGSHGDWYNTLGRVLSVLQYNRLERVGKDYRSRLILCRDILVSSRNVGEGDREHFAYSHSGLREQIYDCGIEEVFALGELCTEFGIFFFRYYVLGCCDSLYRNTLEFKGLTAKLQKMIEGVYIKVHGGLNVQVLEVLFEGYCRIDTHVSSAVFEVGADGFGIVSHGIGRKFVISELSLKLCGDY